MVGGPYEIQFGNVYIGAKIEKGVLGNEIVDREVYRDRPARWGHFWRSSTSRSCQLSFQLMRIIVPMSSDSIADGFAR